MTQETTAVKAPWADMITSDAIDFWDAGQLVHGCSMGGMGIGYEIGIWTVAFEVLRSMEASPADFAAWEILDPEKSQEEAEKLSKLRRDYMDTIEKTENVKAAINDVGPTGAMWGAASNIALVFHKHGYAKGMDMVPKDRRIQISKTVMLER